jgi:hypothetical protein
VLTSETSGHDVLPEGERQVGAQLGSLLTRLKHERGEGCLRPIGFVDQDILDATTVGFITEVRERGLIFD